MDIAKLLEARFQLDTQFIVTLICPVSVLCFIQLLMGFWRNNCKLAR